MIVCFIELLISSVCFRCDISCDPSAMAPKKAGRVAMKIGRPKLAAAMKIGRKKAAKKIGPVASKDLAAENPSTDHETGSSSTAIAKAGSSSSDLKVRAPPSLQQWLDGKTIWGSVQAQGLKDWEKAFKTKGHGEIANKVAAVRAGNLQDRQAFVMKLAVANNVQSLKVFQNDKLVTEEK